MTAGSSPAAPVLADSGEKVSEMIRKVTNFLKEVKVELGKVSWSTRKELLSSTVVVIVSTAILAVFIGAIDLSLSKILSTVFK